MSHEWWANLVTCRDWKDMWIHEGIGTYMQALYIERRFGAEAMRDEMRAQRNNCVNRRAVAPRETQDSNQIYFSASGNDIYYKGSCVMHTLRWLLGDDRFFTALRRMAYPDPAKEKVTDGTQVRFSDTEDIRAIAERHFDGDLGWFFEVYLRQPRLPKLTAEQDGDTLRLRWEAPGDGPFPMPVPVSVGGEIRRVEMPGGTGTVDLNGQAYEIDPDGFVLKDEPRIGRRGRRR